MLHPAFSKDEVAVITGAASGIGKAFSEHCLQLGMRVAMLDVDESRLNAVSAEFGSDAVLPLKCDVANPEDWNTAATEIDKTFSQKPSVLVNNAVTREGKGFDASLDEWRHAIDVNILGVVNGVRCFRDDMVATSKPGVIINVGSKQGITNPPGHPVYNLCKAAVKSYTEGLQHDLRQNSANKVTAHLLVPGWTTTGTAEHKQGAWRPQQVIDYMMKAIAAGSFYIICPDDEVLETMDKERILLAATDITENRVPLSRWYKG